MTETEMDQKSHVERALFEKCSSEATYKAWHRYFLSGEEVADPQALFDTADIRFLTWLKIAELPDVKIFKLARHLIETIVPDPETVTSWPDLIDQLAKRLEYTSDIYLKAINGLEGNETFQESLSASPEHADFSAWAELVKCGDVFDYFLTAIHVSYRARAVDIMFSRSYLQMINRIKAPLQCANLVVEREDSRMLVTVHSRFRPFFVPPFSSLYSENLYAVLGPNLQSAIQISTEPLRMLKMLKKGKSVFIAIDGKRGKLEAIGTLFDQTIAFSDSFIWVAWKARCDMVWAYCEAAPAGVGVSCVPRDLIKAEEFGDDFDAFRTKVIARYTAAVEDAIIQNPFDFGLLYPRRFMDVQRGRGRA